MFPQKESVQLILTWHIFKSDLLLNVILKFLTKSAEITEIKDLFLKIDSSSKIASDSISLLQIHKFILLTYLHF